MTLEETFRYVYELHTALATIRSGLDQPAIEQIDPVLAEDGKTVLLHGWCADDELYMQSFELPEPITEEAFDLVLEEWRQAARAEAWRCVG
jgi:hypothetical protein